MLRTWWWPVFVFLYPLLAAPWSTSSAAPFQAHAYPTLLFLAGGVILELKARGWPSFAELGTAFLRVRRHPVVILALLFGVWVVVAALFSPSPALALTGSLVYGSDGALWELALVAVFVLVYLETLRVPAMGRRIAIAAVAAGLVLTVLALLEVVLHHALIVNVPESALPIVTFPQKGHLAGMLALAGGVAMGLWPNVLVAGIAFGIGLTLNRSAGLALLAAALVPLLRGRKGLRGAAVIAVLAVAGLVAGGVFVKGISTPHKQVASVGSLDSRLYHYRAALNGIAARPVFGWGGGNFDLVWPNYLSRANLARFARAEWGYPKLIDVHAGGYGLPVLYVQDAQGKKVMAQDVAFKAHDEPLDAALMWGVVGAVLYLLLLLLGLRGLRRGDALAWGLATYYVFLLLWFVIPETQGLLWAMLGAAAAGEHGAWSVDRLRPRAERSTEA
ncbi:MAG TPA: O-antigen ligase family protein [Trueperaceae bacterium]|nr:O-antigen ligase family protein [Trueperaceae bacterium]